MKNRSKFQLVFTFLVMLFLTAGNFAKSVNAKTNPDFTGTWEFNFYDNADKLIGVKTLVVSDDGNVSAVTNIYIDNFVYDTRISAVISPDGKIKGGELIYLSKQEMVGSLKGSFTKAGGSGVWKNYMGKSGTWKAVRSDKKVKD